MESVKKRIGIIGGGISGLLVAWLLSGNKDNIITLYEQNERLGGIIQTVRVGRSIVDLGFDSFSKSTAPTFTKLLDILNVKTNSFPMSAVIYEDEDRSERYCDSINGTPMDKFHIPPYEFKKDIETIFNLFNPCSLSHVIQLKIVFDKASDARSTKLYTVEDFVNSISLLTNNFKYNVLYPLLQSGWSIPLKEFLKLSAYDIFSPFLYIYKTRGNTIFAKLVMDEIEGGVDEFLKALISDIGDVNILVNSTISSIHMWDKHWLVNELGKGTEIFDSLIIATNAKDTVKLLAGNDLPVAIIKALNLLEYYTSNIIIHGDYSFMPEKIKDWSLVNIHHDGVYSYPTVFKHWRCLTNLVFETRLPDIPDITEPELIYKKLTYEHIKPDLNYYICRELMNLNQGWKNLWLTGMYVDGIDSYETVLRNAMNIASVIDPASVNLQKLNLSLKMGQNKERNKERK